MANISGLLGSTGVALEAEAYKQFGAAVEGQIGSKLSGIFGLGGSSGSSDPNDARNSVNTSVTRVWDPTPYASALTNYTGGTDPKNKFLFKVRFKFHPVAVQMAGNMETLLKEIESSITFTVKQIDLPKVDFEYEEVNMYNFRTKILKKITFRELSFIIYDDVGNSAIRLIKAYMEILSPITRSRQDGGSRLEDHGFAFNDNLISGKDTSLRGTMPHDAEMGGNRKEIISEIIIEQFYVDMSKKDVSNPSDMVRINRFSFINPRISQFDISDQDHEQNDFNTISLTFDYDSLHIDVNDDGEASEVDQLPGGDILYDVQNRGTVNFTRSASSPAGNAQNPIVGILANQAKRATQSLISGTLNKALGGVAGGALGGAIYNLSGTLANQAGNTMANMGNKVAQGMALPSVSLVKDNAGGPPATEYVSTRQGK